MGTKISIWYDITRHWTTGFFTVLQCYCFGKALGALHEHNCNFLTSPLLPLPLPINLELINLCFILDDLEIILYSTTIYFQIKNLFKSWVWRYLQMSILPVGSQNYGLITMYRVVKYSECSMHCTLHCLGFYIKCPNCTAKWAVLGDMRLSCTVCLLSTIMIMVVMIPISLRRHELTQNHQMQTFNRVFIRIIETPLLHWNEMIKVHITVL